VSAADLDVALDAQAQRAVAFEATTGVRAATSWQHRPMLCSFLQRGALTVLNGAPKTGKSTFLVALTHAIAHNRPDLIGEAAFTGAGDCIAVFGEDARETVLARASAWHAAHDLDPLLALHDAAHWPLSGFCAVERCAGRYQLGADMHTLASEIQRRRKAGRSVALICLDTFRRCFPGVNQNSNVEVAEVLNLMVEFAAAHDVAILITTHPPKGEKSAKTASGASAFESVPRDLLGLSESRQHPVSEGQRLLRLSQVSTNRTPWPGAKFFTSAGHDAPGALENGLPIAMSEAVIAPHVVLPDFAIDQDMQLVVAAAVGLREKGAADKIVAKLKAVRSGVTVAAIEQALAGAVADGRLAVEQRRHGKNKSRAETYVLPNS